MLPVYGLRAPLPLPITAELLLDRRLHVPMPAKRIESSVAQIVASTRHADKLVTKPSITSETPQPPPTPPGSQFGAESAFSV